MKKEVRLSKHRRPNDPIIEPLAQRMLEEYQQHYRYRVIGEKVSDEAPSLKIEIPDDRRNVDHDALLAALKRKASVYGFRIESIDPNNPHAYIVTKQVATRR
ncbi:MAG TPA: hypothetical protein VIM37_03640 [Candidatus Microsaccharimonas sp.]